MSVDNEPVSDDAINIMRKLTWQIRLQGGNRQIGMVPAHRNAARIARHRRHGDTTVDLQRNLDPAVAIAAVAVQHVAILAFLARWVPLSIAAHVALDIPWTRGVTKQTRQSVTGVAHTELVVCSHPVVVEEAFVYRNEWIL